jgi:hypothetical protein
MLFVFFGATSAETPSKRVRSFAFAPNNAGEAPLEGELTPLLKDLVGVWDTSSEVKVGGLPVNLKGRSEVKTAYDGTFIRGVATNAADDRGLVQLATFDKGTKTYRLWIYDSSGTELEFRGTYDEKAKVLAWKSQPGGSVTITLNWKFADAGGYTWDLHAVNGGKTALEMKGDNTTRKK